MPGLLVSSFLILVSSFTSPQYRLNDFSFTQRHGPVEAIADQHLRIDAEAVIDGRGQVGGVGRIAGGKRREAIAGAVHNAALDTTAGQDAGKDARPVVPAIAARAGASRHALTHARRPAKLAGPD